MRLPAASSLAAFLVAALLPIEVFAYCFGWDKSQPDYDPKYYSVAKEFQRSQYVVVATSVRETWLGEDGKPKPLEPPFLGGASRPRGFDPYLGALYEVRVTQTFKGNPPERLTLFSDNSTARFSLLPVGGKFLLFVVGNGPATSGAQLTIDNCGNSEALPKASVAMRELKRLTGRTGAKSTQ
jgi:hypothetical protein